MMVENLEELVQMYKETKDQAVFANIYRIVNGEWQRRRSRDVQYTLSDEHSVQAMYDDVLLKTIGRYERMEEGGGFLNLLSKSIYNAKRDLLKREIRRRRRITLGVDCDHGAATLEIASDHDIEDNVLMRIKRERDQRQLISSLIADTDDLTKKIVELFPKYDSATALGKALGIHHSVVTRKLARLSRRYDPNRFGDINDYLAV